MTERLSIMPCSYFMAKQAVGRWHYSRTMPGSSWHFGVWEGGQFIGAVGHHGGIYQAGGWVYIGESRKPQYKINGKTMHSMSAKELCKDGVHTLEWIKKNLDPHAETVWGPAKHRYLLPLDREMRLHIAPRALPYPKRAGSIDSDASSYQPEEGGASPTSALDLFGEVA